MADDQQGAVPGRVHIVPHTHWDREWYWTFATYRGILIELVDGLVEMLDRNPAFRAFTFDGQVAPIDDYLNAIEPAERAAAEAKLKQLIIDGRIHVGPWYTLSDQFLVSGETTLRNLQWGIARATELGKVMDVAYCPDQFGLIPELPKILREVGISKVIGERGMKRELPMRFVWKTADGSAVEVFNLKEGYYHHDITADAFKKLAARHPGEAALFLAGSDHSVPFEGIADSAAAAGARMSSIPEFWADLAPLRNPHVYRGEIRSAGDKNLLPNVISNRVDQRLLTSRAERGLERYAEPLAAFAMARYPSQLLQSSWRNQIENAAHDSACASGVDEVTRQVMARAQETLDTAAAISWSALREFAPKLRDFGEYVWNPSNFERDIVIQDEPGMSRVARRVPPLGWAKLARKDGDRAVEEASIPAVRFVDEPDSGDTYTFDPTGPAKAVALPTTVRKFADEPFSRINVTWENNEHNHRTRILIKLPQHADHSVADTPFGEITRPAVPDLVQGADRNNGFPASKFIVAGGIAVMLDRTAEYEILPETNELAITLVRAHGWLSQDNPQFRKGGAGPHMPTHETQMHQEISWNIAVMPWDETKGLPWKEWERAHLDMLEFESFGGGDLPSRGTYFHNLPRGILSAVLPGVVRVFDETKQHRIVTKQVAVTPPTRRGVAGLE